MIHRGCGKPIDVLKPAGQSALTLEFEEARHVTNTCGSTGYSGHKQLCPKCEALLREAESYWDEFGEG